MVDYAKIAKDARKTVLRLIYKAQVSHIGSNFSCADIMAVLFEKIDLDKDKFVLSAGWKAAMLYYHLWRKGRITEEELNSYCQPGSKWIGLSEPIHKDIKIAGGSMGMGLPGAVGLALAKKLKANNCERCKRVLENEKPGSLYPSSHGGCPCECHGKVYVLASDGEMDCGTTWESALIAAHHKLDNLVVIVDCNKFQATGRTKEILEIDGRSGGYEEIGTSLEEKWLTFNWDVFSINGHSYDAINKATDPKAISLYFMTRRKRPKIIIAHTVKGKGVSFMEKDGLVWHYRNVDDDSYKLALKELNKYV